MGVEHQLLIFSFIIAGVVGIFTRFDIDDSYLIKGSKTLWALAVFGAVFVFVWVAIGIIFGFIYIMIWARSL